ncbi:Cofactor assembly of complex C subunit B [Trema orientale]|uniref:Cofactor assembly of complex C subunit B n=1 Tax=Trema orientale TaxID=63057 RepID=A0A2P5D6C6_TREOI|nr:Cofactor assembly of complex C subunit B [Trema orientale]
MVFYDPWPSIKAAESFSSKQSVFSFSARAYHWLLKDLLCGAALTHEFLTSSPHTYPGFLGILVLGAPVGGAPAFNLGTSSHICHGFLGILASGAPVGGAPAFNLGTSPHERAIRVRIPGLDESSLPRWIGYGLGSLLVLNHITGSNSVTDITSPHLRTKALGLSLAAFFNEMELVRKTVLNIQLLCIAILSGKLLSWLMVSASSGGLRLKIETHDMDEIHNCVIKLDKVCIGCRAGFGGDRPLGALKLLQRVKGLNYLVLERLAERTLADRYQVMVSGGDGYDPRMDPSGAQEIKGYRNRKQPGTE